MFDYNDGSFIDYLYKYFGGERKYSKEEWEQLTKRNYDVVEVDTEIKGNDEVLYQGRTYKECCNLLLHSNIKDFDFEIQLRDNETGKALAVKRFSPIANGGVITVYKI